jgi:hypothetical protein
VQATPSEQSALDTQVVQVFRSPTTKVDSLHTLPIASHGLPGLTHPLTSASGSAGVQVSSPSHLSGSGQLALTATLLQAPVPVLQVSEVQGTSSLQSAAVVHATQLFVASLQTGVTPEQGLPGRTQPVPVSASELAVLQDPTPSVPLQNKPSLHAESIGVKTHKPVPTLHVSVVQENPSLQLALLVQTMAAQLPVAVLQA